MTLSKSEKEDVLSCVLIALEETKPRRKDNLFFTKKQLEKFRDNRKSLIKLFEKLGKEWKIKIYEQLKYMEVDQK